jgi:hypothetical protein
LPNGSASPPAFTSTAPFPSTAPTCPRPETATFFDGGIIDFRHLFIVHARAVDPAHRVASLLDDVLDELEVRFSAHTVRRGPNVIDRNADKLITLLRSAGVTDADANEAGARVARALNLSWRTNSPTSCARSQPPPPKPPRHSRASSFASARRRHARRSSEQPTGVCNYNSGVRFLPPPKARESPR